MIKCCLNGRHPLDLHPALPRTSADAALEAEAAVATGAGALHFHPRAADGPESLEAEDVALWVAAIEDRCPGIPHGISTGAWIEPDLGRRLAAISGWRSPLPGFASVNVAEEGAAQVAAALLDRGVALEAGVWLREDVDRLVGMGLDGAWLRILVEAVCEPENQLERVGEIDAALDAAGVTAPRLYHGYGGATWGVVADALARGKDVRIGLEDVQTLPDGEPAEGNAELVRTAVGLLADPG